MCSSRPLGISALLVALVVGGCGSKSAPPRLDGSVDAAKESKPGDAAIDTGKPTDVAVESSPPTDVAADSSGPTDAASDSSDATDDVTDSSDATEAGVGALLVYGTGVDGTGKPLPGGSVDPHYTLLQSADATLKGPDAIVTSQIADGFWLPQSETSKWIAPSANQAYPGASPCNDGGTYVYRTTFDLTGRDPATFKLDGKWAADNMGAAIRLNGASLGLTAGGYSPFTDFSITTGFVAGKNTLDFEVFDFGCPNGLRVELSVPQNDGGVGN